MTNLDRIVLAVKDKLLECLSTVVNDFNITNMHYLYIINHGSWWTIAYEPINITFIDLIKGIVPFDLTDNINNITNNKEATLEICRNIFQCIYTLSQQIWLEQCERVVQKEHLLNISNKMKKKSNFEGNKFERSAYVDPSIYSSMTNVITSADSLIDKMVTRGCHFSNF